MFVKNRILLPVRVDENVVHIGRRSATAVDVLRIRVAIHSARIAIAAATSALKRRQVVRVQGRVEVMIVVRIRRQNQGCLH